LDPILRKVNAVLICGPASVFIMFNSILQGAWGSVAVKALRSRTVPGSIPGGVAGDFFLWLRWNHVLWGRLSF